MFHKIALFVLTFQLFIVMIMADSCNIFFTTSRSATDGPQPVEAGVCYSYTKMMGGKLVYNAWLDGVPSGKGRIKFYSGASCEPNTLVFEGSSPVNLVGGHKTLGSVFIQNCT